MSEFAEGRASAFPDAVAPDGSQVHLLLTVPGRAGTALFRLAPAAVARAVEHPRVEEIWYVLAGEGVIWRKQGDREEETALAPGLVLTIPRGTRFQFRSTGTEDLVVFGVTMPPWAGEEDAVAAPPHWEPSV